MRYVEFIDPMMKIKWVMLTCALMVHVKY